METVPRIAARAATALALTLCIGVAGSQAQPVNDNGGFEADAVGDTPLEGVQSWAFSGWAEGLARFEVVSAPVSEGTRALQVTVDAVGSDPWSIEATNEGIPVTANTTYTYSVWARSDLDGATANFTVGNGSYQELGRVDNGSVSLTSTWQRFSFEFTVGDETTVRAPIHLSFAANQTKQGGGPKATIVPGVIHIDDLRVEAVAAPEPVPPPSTTPLATGHAKFLGNVYSSSQITDFEYYWTQMTPENAGKWGTVEGTRDVMDWTALDAAYDFAQAHALPFRFHVLVWGSQYPAWIDGLPPAEQYEEVEEWFAAVAARYPDLDYVEVVNEPLNQAVSFKDALGGDGGTGWDWVINAFTLARQYFPESRLMINEYNMISARKGELRNYKNIIQLLQDRGLIDGIGVQGHAFSTDWQAASVMVGNLDELALHGLPIQITEMDVDGPTDEEQLAEYQRIFPSFWEHPAVEGITLWGWRPGMWRTEQKAYLVETSGAERPAMPWLRDYLATAAASADVSSQAVAAAAPIEGPGAFSLGVASPNPFNPTTTIRFTLPTASRVSLVVYDALGREVTRVVDGERAAGVHEAVFEAGDQPSGVYLYRLQAHTEDGQAFSQARRVVLAK